MYETKIDRMKRETDFFIIIGRYFNTFALGTDTAR